MILFLIALTLLLLATLHVFDFKPNQSKAIAVVALLIALLLMLSALGVVTLQHGHPLP